MEFKNFDDLVEIINDDSKDIPEEFRPYYVIGRLEAAYKVLYSEYMALLIKKK